MTIVMIGQKGLPARSGGIEHHVQALAKGLVQRGHRVIVFGRRWYVQGASAPQGVEQVLSKGIRTKHLDAITHSFTALFASNRFSPDIIHLHGVGIALLAPLARLLCPRSKLVVTFHCMDRRFSKWGWFARLSFRIGEWMTCLFAHEVVTVSQELQRYCAMTYGRRAEYISHAFAFERPARMDEAENRVRSLGLKPYKYILFVGRLLPHKGAHRFLKAFQRAQKEHRALFAQTQAVIVGGSSFTDLYAQQVQDLITQTPNTQFLGERFDEDLRALQSCALGHIFPTTEEGLSLALLEAASTGRPVLMQNIDANREATGGYAQIIDVTSEEALSRSLTELVATPEKIRETQGQTLATYVAYAFGATRNIDALDRLYRELTLENGELVTLLAGNR